MFGYVTFDMKYYILSQKIGWVSRVYKDPSTLRNSI